MPQPVYDFCYAPVTYLVEYAFTFTLRHGNSPPSSYTLCLKKTTIFNFAVTFYS